MPDMKKQSVTRLRRRDVFRAAAIVGYGAAGSIPAARATAKAPAEPMMVATPPNAVVETVSGKVRGYTESGIFTFKGIPYAATTEGKNRFLPPQNAAPWPGVRNSMSYGPVCPQFRGRTASTETRGFQLEREFSEEHEDCLCVNLWTPGINDGKKRPVLFWLHSMGFHSGSGHDFRFYDGTNLARRGDVVVVSINHRLNILGFCNLAEYGEQYSDSANVGLLDIVAALTWVRDNIARFGGDPGNLTVFGQSGGGMKVCALLAMPSAKGLFHKAIVQSGPRVKLGSPELSAKLATGMLKELGLTKATVSELHKLEFRKLREAAITASRYSDAPWPSVDGRVLPAHPFDPVAPVISADVPLLIGTAQHEGINRTQPISEDELKEELRKQYPRSSGKIYDLLGQIYPGTSANERLAISTRGGSGPDAQHYRRESVAIAKRKAALQAAPVYAYIFAWQTPIFSERPARAVHFMDLPFVFYNTDRCAHATGGTAQARQLAAKMSDAWVCFARTGNPGHSALPRWPAFSAGRDATMFFNDRCEVKFDHDRELLALLGEIPE